MSHKLTSTLCFSALAIGLVLALVSAPAQADPLPGRDTLKFSQLPMDGTPIFGTSGTVERFYGHDEESTAYSSIDASGLQSPYTGRFMADDFADRFNSPVVHVKWWGSYLDNYVDPAMPVDKFLISFESDVPGPVPGFSHPGIPLLNQIVKRGPLSPSSGTFTENPISPGGDPLNERLYEYNAELHLGKEFFQQPDTVYWLKIVALVDLPPGFVPGVDPTTRWGWHNRDYTVNDPLASVAPQVTPGEYIEGYVGPAALPTPVWHFQDDAVMGSVVVDHLSTPDGQIMPLVTQTGYQPTLYLDGIDGPPGIGNLSKDLAFQLYTVVPEPASIIMACCGLLFLGFCALRRRRSDMDVGQADAQDARRSVEADDQGGIGPTELARHGRLDVTNWRGGRTIFSLARGAATGLAAVIAATAMSTSASALTTGNLLTDPGWDTPLTNALDTYINVFNGPIYNTWGVEAAAVVGAENGITPAGGNGMLRENLTVLVASQSFQIVDVSAYSSAINAGSATADFGALFNVPDVLAGALCNVALTFRDSSNSVLGSILSASSFTFGGLDGNPNTWQSLVITGAALPAGTARINAEVAYSNASLQSSYPGYVDRADLRLTIVPEPATLALLGIGIAGAICFARRRSQRGRCSAAVLAVGVAAIVATGSTNRVQAANIITNGGFELPANANSTVGQYNESLVPGWETTASDNNIEIWSNGYLGVVAAEGVQHAELNATEVSTLYQDVPGIAANSTVGYSFAHRGRQGIDTLRLTISDLGTDNLPGGVGTAADSVLFTQPFSTGNAAWVQYSSSTIGNLTLGNDMRFAFASISAAGGNQAIGNFLDDVRFGIGVPEPTSWVLAGISAVGAVGLVRRRAQRQTLLVEDSAAT